MKLVPGAGRSTSVLTPPTLSSRPPLSSTGDTPPPSGRLFLLGRRIVKPLFSAGQPDKRREAGCSCFLRLVTNSSVPTTDFRPPGKMFLQTPANGDVTRKGNCVAFGERWIPLSALHVYTGWSLKDIKQK